MNIYEWSIKKVLCLLILSLIICSSLTIVFEYAFGLDEFIDNYLNYDYVQARHDVVRNTTYNCMELEMGVGARVYEDFTTYIEIDAPNRLSQTVTRSTWTNLLRSDGIVLLYFDFGAGYFTNFIHEFDFKLTQIDATSGQTFRVCPIAYSNYLDDLNGVKNSGSQEVSIIAYSNNVANQYLLAAVEQSGFGSWYGNGSSVMNINTMYYLKSIKSGSLVEFEIYSNSARTIMIEKISITLQSNWSFRYILCPQSIDGVGNWKSSGYVEYLWIGTITGGYADDGDFYTVEVLSAFNGSTIVLLTNSTIPIGDSLTVEFSNDNATWLDHEGNVGSDTVIEGFESIDLRDLNYTQLYMRFNFTDGLLDSTPRLYQIRVITTDVVIGVVSNPGFWIIGILIFIPIILVIVWSLKK